jgi:hypothetical protein
MYSLHSTRRKTEIQCPIKDHLTNSKQYRQEIFLHYRYRYLARTSLFYQKYLILSSDSVPLNVNVLQSNTYRKLRVNQRKKLQSIP